MAEEQKTFNKEDYLNKSGSVSRKKLGEKINSLSEADRDDIPQLLELINEFKKQSYENVEVSYLFFNQITTKFNEPEIVKQAVDFSMSDLNSLQLLIVAKERIDKASPYRQAMEAAIKEDVSQSEDTQKYSSFLWGAVNDYPWLLEEKYLDMIFEKTPVSAKTYSTYLENCMAYAEKRASENPQMITDFMQRLYQTENRYFISEFENDEWKSNLKISKELFAFYDAEAAKAGGTDKLDTIPDLNERALEVVKSFFPEADKEKASETLNDNVIQPEPEVEVKVESKSESEPESEAEMAIMAEEQKTFNKEDYLNKSGSVNRKKLGEKINSLSEADRADIPQLLELINEFKKQSYENVEVSYLFFNQITTKFNEPEIVKQAVDFSMNRFRAINFLLVAKELDKTSPYLKAMEAAIKEDVSQSEDTQKYSSFLWGAVNDYPWLLEEKYLDMIFEKTPVSAKTYSTYLEYCMKYAEKKASQNPQMITDFMRRLYQAENKKYIDNFENDQWNSSLKISKALFAFYDAEADKAGGIDKLDNIPDLNERALAVVKSFFPEADKEKASETLNDNVKQPEPEVEVKVESKSESEPESEAEVEVKAEPEAKEETPTAEAPAGAEEKTETMTENEVPVAEEKDPSFYWNISTLEQAEEIISLLNEASTREQISGVLKYLTILSERRPDWVIEQSYRLYEKDIRALNIYDFHEEWSHNEGVTRDLYRFYDQKGASDEIEKNRVLMEAKDVLRKAVIDNKLVLAEQWLKYAESAEKALNILTHTANYATHYTDDEAELKHKFIMDLNTKAVQYVSESLLEPNKTNEMSKSELIAHYRLLTSFIDYPSKEIGSAVIRTHQRDIYRAASKIVNSYLEERYAGVAQEKNGILSRLNPWKKNEDSFIEPENLSDEQKQKLAENMAKYTAMDLSEIHDLMNVIYTFEQDTVDFKKESKRKGHTELWEKRKHSVWMVDMPFRAEMDKQAIEVESGHEQNVLHEEAPVLPEEMNNEELVLDLLDLNGGSVDEKPEAEAEVPVVETTEKVETSGTEFVINEGAEIEAADVPVIENIAEAEAPTAQAEEAGIEPEPELEAKIEVEADAEVKEVAEAKVEAEKPVEAKTEPKAKVKPVEEKAIEIEIPAPTPASKKAAGHVAKAAEAKTAIAKAMIEIATKAYGADSKVPVYDRMSENLDIRVAPEAEQTGKEEFALHRKAGDKSQAKITGHIAIENDRELTLSSKEMQHFILVAKAAKKAGHDKLKVGKLQGEGETSMKFAANIVLAGAITGMKVDCEIPLEKLAEVNPKINILIEKRKQRAEIHQQTEKMKKAELTEAAEQFDKLEMLKEKALSYHLEHGSIDERNPNDTESKRMERMEKIAKEEPKAKDTVKRARGLENRQMLARVVKSQGK